MNTAMLTESDKGIDFCILFRSVFLEVTNVEHFAKLNIYMKGRHLVADRIMLSKILQFNVFYQSVTICFFWVELAQSDPTINGSVLPERTF